MVDPRPVIVIATASKDIRGHSPLDLLPREASDLRDVLRKAETKGLCQVLERREATIDELLQVFQDAEYRNRIAIFHFGGHGDAYSLLVEDASRQPAIIAARGLAAFLAGLPGLQLVFLNACSTASQTKALRKAGVPAVVATSNDIEDEIALNFAHRFYNGIAEDSTVAASYEAAVAELYLRNAGRVKPQWRLSGAEAGRRWKLSEGIRMPSVPACPYPGLKAFQQSQRSSFFGRDAEIDEALEKLRHDPFLALIGASGSGKTSLLFAGIVPALQDQPNFRDSGITVKELRPGSAPPANLARVLGADVRALSGGSTFEFERPAGRKLILVIDSFEELFAAESGEVSTFEAVLRNVMASPDTIVVMAARADFYPNLMASTLWPKIKKHRMEITPLKGEALRLAIEKPANDVGVTISPPLVQQLLADAGEEPGVLPLIQETLVMLWRYVRGLRIDLDAYQRIVKDKSGRSGLAVALAGHADHVYDEVLANEEERAIARRVFLRLIQFGEGRADTRRQQTAAELGEDLPPLTYNSVLERLTLNRLITVTSEGDDKGKSVDLSHEALIRGWPLLQDWILKRKAAEQTRRRLEERARERERLRQQHVEGGLLDIVALAEAEAWVKSEDATELGASPQLRDLILDSRTTYQHREQEKEGIRQAELARLAELAEAQTERARQEALRADSERRRAAESATSNVKLLRALIAAGVIAVVAVLAAGVAFRLYGIAEEQQKYAEEQRQKALSAGAAAEARRIDAEAAQATAEVERRAADSARKEAEATARRLRADYLAAKAESRMQVDQIDDDVALILARDSVLATWDSADHFVTSQADMALRHAVEGTLWRMTLPSSTERHLGRVSDLAFSPDGLTLVSGGSDGTVRLWNAHTLQPIRTLLGHAGAVNAVAFNPLGNMIASAGADDTVRLWDAQTGSERRLLQGHTGEVSAVAFTPDGKFLLSAGDDSTVRIWDAASGQQVRFFRSGLDNITSIAVSADGLTGAGVVDGKSVYLWDIASGAQHQALTSTTALFGTVLFSPDGRSLAVFDSDQVQLWDSQARQLLGSFPSQSSSPNSYAFNSNGDDLISLGYETISIRDVGSGVVRNLDANVGGTSIAVSPLGNIIAVGFDSGAIQLRDLVTGEQVSALPGHSGAVRRAALSPDGHTIATGGEDASVRLWNGTTGEQQAVMLGHTDGINSIAYSPDGKTIASSSSDGTVRLWAVATGETLQVLDPHSGPMHYANFSPDGMTLVSGGVDGIVRIWNTVTGALERKWQASKNDIYWVGFDSDGQAVGVATSAGVALWTASTGELIKSLANSDTSDDVPMSYAAFGINGKLLAGSTYDGRVRVWQIDTGELIATLESHNEPVTAALINNDGDTIMTAGKDGIIRFWSAETGRQVRTLRGHRVPVQWIAINSAGDKIVSASDDGTARLWTLRSEEQLGDASTGREGVVAAAFSRDDSLIAAAHASGTVAVWDVKTGKKLLTAPDDYPFTDSISFNRDGTMLLLSGYDRTFRLLDMSTGKWLRQEAVPSFYSYAGVDFTDDGMQIVSVQSSLSDGKNFLRYWEPKADTERTIELPFQGELSRVVFSPDGKTMVGVDQERNLHVWDMKTVRQLALIDPKFTNHMISVAFSPDGETIATTNSQNSEIRFWDVRSGELVYVLNPPLASFSAAAYSPDGQTILSSGADGLRLWNANTYEPQRAFTDLGPKVATASFSKDSKHILAAGKDGLLHIVPANIDDLLSLAKGRIQRPVDILYSFEASSLDSGY